MLAALDVHYSDDTAHAAAVVFETWISDSVTAQYTTAESPIAEYEPGQFYMRELSPLLAVIMKIQQPIDIWIIDGYCHLSADGDPGLGVHLAEALDSDAPVIGVAKNPYRQTQHAAQVLRADSKRPLYVTAVGMDYKTAADHVAAMAGEFRIPTLLKAADQLSRKYN